MLGASTKSGNLGKSPRSVSQPNASANRKSAPKAVAESTQAPSQVAPEYNPYVDSFPSKKHSDPTPKKVSQPPSVRSPSPSASPSTKSLKHGKQEIAPNGLGIDVPPKFSVAFPDFTRLGRVSSLVARPPTNNYSKKIAKALEEHPKKEISSISDRHGHGIPAKASDVDFIVPDSIIPERYHVFEDLSDGITGKATGKKVKVFPSSDPSNRSEALLLEKSFEKMMSDSAGEFRSSLAACQNCMNEVIRQVGIHCVERGRILSKIWVSYTRIVEDEMNQLNTGIDEAINESRKMKLEYENLNADFDSKLADLEKVEDELRHSNIQLSEEVKFLREQMEPLLADQETLHKIQRHKHDYQNLMNRIRRIFSRLGKYCDFIETNEFVEFTEDDFGKIQKLMEEEETLNKLEGTDPFFPDETELVKWIGDVELLWKFCQDQHMMIMELKEAEQEDRRILLDLHAELKEKESKIVPKYAQTKEIQTTEAPPPAPDADVWGEIYYISLIRPPIRFIFISKDTPNSQSSSKVPSQPELYKTIIHLYKEKVKADSLDEIENTPKQAFPEFIYDISLSKYGVRSVAEQYVVDVMEACRRFCTRDKRIKMFASIIGVMNPFDENLIDFFMNILKQLLDSDIGFSFEESVDGRWIIDISRAMGIANHNFGAASFVTAKEINEQMNEIALTIPKPDSSDYEPSPSHRNQRGRGVGDKSPKPGTLRVIDFDDFIEILVNAEITEVSTRHAYLEGLFLASDTNQDDHLHYEEFVNLIRFADPSVTERQIAKMFAEASKSSGSESVNLSAFLRVALKHGIGSMSRMEESYTPDVLEQLKKSWKLLSVQVEKEISLLPPTPGVRMLKLANNLKSSASRFNKELESSRNVAQVERLFKRVVGDLIFVRRARMEM